MIVVAVGRRLQRLRQPAVLPARRENATVQLTLFNFQSQFGTRWNLLFMDVLLITIPPLIMFIFFQRQIVSGMTAGRRQGRDCSQGRDPGCPWRPCEVSWRRMSSRRTRDPSGLTWTLRSHRMTRRAASSAYEIEALADDGSERRWTSGEVSRDEQVAVPAPDGMLAAAIQGRFESGSGRRAGGPLERRGPRRGWPLDAADWVGEAITLQEDPGAAIPSPSPLLRRSSTVDGAVRRARLYVTSYGLHRIALNGSRVTDDVLAPGWTPYGKRIVAETYDVTDLLGAGENVIGAALADGWYRGRLGWESETARNTYGSRLALLAQLELILEDGTSVDRRDR